MARDYSSIACHVTKDNIIEIGPKTTQRSDVYIPEDFGTGFSIVGYEKGLLITGGSNHGANTFLW